VLRRILGTDPQIIAPVRSIPEIIASFMLISQKIGAKSKIEDEVALANRESNPWTLSRVIWERYIYANYFITSREVFINYMDSAKMLLDLLTLLAISNLNL
jgi:hypothetical protein